MSIWRAKWAREAEEQRPLYKVSCQHPNCDYCVLSTDPYLTKVHHQGEAHFGHPMAYNVTKWQKPTEASNANG